jgi:hypothetical protein
VLTELGDLEAVELVRCAFAEESAGGSSKMYLRSENCTTAEAFAPGLRSFQQAPYKCVPWAPSPSHGRRTAVRGGAQTPRVTADEAGITRGAQLSDFERFWDLAILETKGFGDGTAFEL